MSTDPGTVGPDPWDAVAELFECPYKACRVGNAQTAKREQGDHTADDKLLLAGLLRLRDRGRDMSRRRPDRHPSSVLSPF